MLGAAHCKTNKETKTDIASWQTFCPWLFLPSRDERARSWQPYCGHEDADMRMKSTSVERLCIHGDVLLLPHQSGHLLAPYILFIWDEISLKHKTELGHSHWYEHLPVESGLWLSISSPHEEINKHFIQRQWWTSNFLGPQSTKMNRTQSLISQKLKSLGNMWNDYIHNSCYHCVSGTAHKRLTRDDSFDPGWSNRVETAPALLGSSGSVSCS